MKSAVLLAAMLIVVSAIVFWMLRQSNGAVISLTPGTTFQWHKGTSYTAIEPATIHLPGAILGNEAKIGDIIQADDDNMEIGFMPRHGASGFERIVLRFKQGQSVTLGRSSDAILIDEANLPKRFHKRGK
jgi:hypothetical protein